MQIIRFDKIVIIFLFSFLFVVPLFSGCLDSPEKSSGEDFVFTTLDRQTKHLRDYQGTVVVLDLMAVNCKYCIDEMFTLKQISENYSHQGVAIISIDVWIASGETVSLLQQYINAFKQQANLTLDWTFGVDDNQGTLERKYASNGVPTLYIFDKKGNIYYSHPGYEGYATLSLKLDELLMNA